MQTCFFALAGVLPRDEAIAAIKDGDREDLRQARRAVVERNFAAVDAALAALHEVEVPPSAPATVRRRPPRPRRARPTSCSG